MVNKDPVCGMSLDDDSRYKSRFDGHDYAFCSEACKNKFDRAPEDYAAEGVGSGRQAE
jgi:P-type Cu+ transporter